MAFTREQVQRLLPQAEKELTDHFRAHNDHYKIKQEARQAGRTDEWVTRADEYDQPMSEISRGDVEDWFTTYHKTNIQPQEQAAAEPQPEPSTFDYIVGTGKEAIGRAAKAVGANLPNEFYGEDIEDFGSELTSSGVRQATGSTKAQNEISNIHDAGTVEVIGNLAETLPEQVLAPVSNTLLAAQDLVGVDASNSPLAANRRMLDMQPRAEGLIGQGIQVLGNMAARLPTYAVTGPLGIGGDVGTDSYLQAREEGYDKGIAAANGVVKGGLAYFLNKKLGTLDKTIGFGATSIPAAGIAEGIEEGSQAVLDPVVDYLTKGTPIPEASEYASNVAKAAAWGMFGGGTMRGVMNKAQRGAVVPNEELHDAQKELSNIMTLLESDPSQVDLEGVTSEGPQTKEALAMAALFKKRFGKSADVKINLKVGNAETAGTADINGNSMDIYVDQNAPVEGLLRAMVHEDGHIVLKEIIGDKSFDALIEDIKVTQPEAVQYAMLETERVTGDQITEEAAAEELMMNRLDSLVLSNDAKWKIAKSKIGNWIGKRIGKKVAGHEVDIKIREAYMEYRKSDQIHTVADRANRFQETLRQEQGVTLPGKAETFYVAPDGDTLISAAEDFMSEGRILDQTERIKNQARREDVQRRANQELPAREEEVFGDVQEGNLVFPREDFEREAAVFDQVQQAKAQQQQTTDNLAADESIDTFRAEQEAARADRAQGAQDLFRAARGITSPGKQILTAEEMNVQAKRIARGQQPKYKLKTLSEMNPKLFGKIHQNPTFMELMSDHGVKTALKSKMLDLTLSYLDKRAGLRNAGLKDGYRTTRMLADVPERMLGMLYDGLTTFDVKNDYAETRDETSQGFFKDFVLPAGEDLNGWFEWKAAQRAKTLGDRAGKFTPAEISAIDNKYATKAGLFGQLNETFVKYNRNMMQKMVDAELLTTQEVENLGPENWIPFTRAIDEDSPGYASGDPSVVKAQLKRMQGSDEKIDENMFANVYKNWAYLYRAARLNIANKTALKEMDRHGDLYVTELTEAQAKGKDNVAGFTEIQEVEKTGADGRKFMSEEAVTRQFEVHDDSIYGSLITEDPATAKWTRFPSMASGALRYGTTHSAGFVMANFLRDSMVTWAVSDDVVPMWTALKGASEILRKTPVFFRANDNGATFMSHDAKASYEQLSKEVDRIAENDGKNRVTLNPFKSKLWKLWQQVIELSENANRVGVFAAKEGKVGTKQAAFEARDLMDFSGTGSSEGLSVVSKLLPFFNSRLQGNYKIYRAIADNPGMVTKKMGALAGAAAAYAFLNSDNDEYKKLPPEDKLNYWHFWFGDTHVRLPKPFELGYVATLFEIGTDTFTDSIPAGQSAWTAWQGLRNSLSFDGLPQFMKPVVETMFNHSLFTGREIDASHQKGLPYTKYNQQTTSGSRLASKGLDRLSSTLGSDGAGMLIPKLSGQKIDHLIRGYFGTMAMQAMGLADLVIDSYSDLPGKMGGGLVERGTDVAKQITGVNRFVVGDNRERDRRITDMYDAIDSHRDVMQSFADAAKAGDAAEVIAIQQAYPHVVRNSEVNKAFTKQLQGISRQIKEIINTKLKRADKEKLIGSLRKTKSQIAKNYEMVMDQLAKNP